MSQIEGIANKIAPKAGIKVNLKPESYNYKKFSSDAVRSAAIKSRIIKMAYAISRIQEPDARAFSDSDIQRSIDQIGGATGSPQQMFGIMRTIRMDAIRSISDRHRQMYGTPWKPEGLSDETLQYGKSLGLSNEEIIMRHMLKD